MMYLGNDVKVVVSHQDWLGQTGIYIALTAPDGRKLAQPVELIFAPIEEGALARPTFTMDDGFAHQLLVALAEALDKEGIKPPSEAFLHGELQATKYHLEDIRKIALGRKA